jgi:hypothetical protein
VLSLSVLLACNSVLCHGRGEYSNRQFRRNTKLQRFKANLRFYEFRVTMSVPTRPLPTPSPAILREVMTPPVSRTVAMSAAMLSASELPRLAKPLI